MSSFSLKNSPRNQVALTGSWVRIPPPPPSSSRTLYRSRRLFFEKSSLTHAVAPAPRKKSRLLRLCPCKRGHYASAALSTFCGCAPAAREFKPLYEMPKKSFLLWLDKGKRYPSGWRFPLIWVFMPARKQHCVINRKKRASDNCSALCR